MSRFLSVPMLLLTLAACGDAPLPSGPDTAPEESVHAALETTVIVCGQVVTESIALANDLHDCPGHGIVVGAADVVIDGRGHAIDGDGVGDDYGVQVPPGGNHRVTVRNLTVRDFGTGVWIYVSEGGHVVNNDVRSNPTGIYLGTGTSGYVVRGNRSASIYSMDWDNVVSHNRISGWIDLAGASRNEVLNNSVNGGSITLIQSSGNRVEHNRITGGGLSVYGSYGNTISGNKVSGGLQDPSAQGAGIWLAWSAGNVLSGNMSSGSSGDGFLVTGENGDNEITGNQARANGGYGFRDIGIPYPPPAVVSPNAYEGNLCIGNEAGGSSPAGLCKAVGGR